jgi:hypothetical protein
MAENAILARISNDAEKNMKVMFLVRQLWHTAKMQGSETETTLKKLTLRLASKVGNQACSRMLRAILKNDRLARGHVPTFLDHVAENPGLLPTAAQVLFCMPEQQLHEWASLVSVNLAKTATGSTTIPKTKTRYRMHIWLQLLCNLDSRSLLRSDKVVDVALRSVAKHVLAEPKEVQTRFQWLMSGLLVKAALKGASQHIVALKIPDLLASLETRLEQSVPLSIDAGLGALISLLQQHDVPHESLVGLILDTFSPRAGLETLLSLMHVLDKRKLVLADSAPFQYAIDERVAALRCRSESMKLTEKARQRFAYQLQICQQIIHILSRVSSTPVFLMPGVVALQAQRQFNHILIRAQSSHALPLAYRDLTASLTIQERVNIIHQLAHQYSIDNTRPQRQAWRAMYYLYKYLQTYSLSMGPLFSKAIVRISIVRPLSENQFVSARRLIWVCHVVARVEGEDVVRKLEKDFWEWRGDLIKHAKSVYVGVGGHPQDKAHIGTMKRLGLI